MLKLCGARARTNGHMECRQPAMGNGRCRLHGGKTPKKGIGPKTEEGKLRQKMASWKHGMCSKEAIEESRRMRQFIKESKQLIAGV